MAVDVCHALDIGNPSDALNRLDSDERTLVSIEGASNGKPVNGVNEPGLYSLVLGSRKPEAKAFKRRMSRRGVSSKIRIPDRKEATKRSTLPCCQSCKMEGGALRRFSFRETRGPLPARKLT